MEEEIKNVEQGAKKAWPVVMGWVGGITALIGLFATVAGGVTWLVNHHKAKTERQAKLTLAQTQASQQDYQAAVQTYGDILKADPLDRPVLYLQLSTAMQWAEDFHVAVREDQHAEDLAGPALDQIFAIFEAGLTRTKGSQAADVQAHLGWAHWLNQHIAEREFGPAAEQDFRAALATDPSNVYANAMLGNWMLQNGGDFNEAIHHLDVAVATGKARPLVRAMQIDGLTNLERPGARAAQVKAANDMRKTGEPLNEDDKRRILSFCFDPVVTDHKELTESLSAVPLEDAWQTYLWLDDNTDEAQGHTLVHEFIQANLLEIGGKRQESLEKFCLLEQELKNSPGTMKDAVNAAIARLSHS